MRTLLVLAAALMLFGSASAASSCHPSAQLTTPTGTTYLVDASPCEGCLFSIWVYEMPAACDGCIFEAWVYTDGEGCETSPIF